MPFSQSDSLRLRYCEVTGDTKSCNDCCESIPPSSGGTNSNFSPVVFTRVERLFRSTRNKYTPCQGYSHRLLIHKVELNDKITILAVESFDRFDDQSQNFTANNFILADLQCKSANQQMFSLPTYFVVTTRQSFVPCGTFSIT